MSQPLAGVPGGIGLGVDEYAQFLGREYLADYVRAGGAAVRVVAPGDDEVGKRWHAALAEVATDAGYHVVALDSADVRIHLLQEVALTVTRSIDWRATAVAVVRACYEREGLPARESVLVQRVAAEHAVDARELNRTMRRALEYDVLGEPRLSTDFRRAMLRLCQAEITGGVVANDERDDVLGWLHGEKVPLTRLRGLLIGSRIDRSTARGVLLSVPVWLAKAGRVGLVLDLDLHRLSVARRPPVPEREGHYYSRPAIFDAYEVLRQLIDATDDMHHCLVVATLPPSLVADDNRGLPAYSALHLRVADEVHDRRRANPFAALVRLEARLEVVA